VKEFTGGDYMRKHNGVTIKDVAVRAGVSYSTVSRVLSGKISAQGASAEAVLKATKELNYKPNMNAKGLKGQSTMTIALMIPDLDSLYYSFLIRNIEKYATLKGYTILFYNSRRSIELEKKILNEIAMRSIDGVLCMSVGEEVGHIVKARNQYNVPIVMFNRYKSPDFCNISVDNIYGGFLLTEYLLDMGHEKIAVVMGDCNMQFNKDRLKGYCQALEKNNLPYNEGFIAENSYLLKDAYNSVIRIFAKKGEHPTAIFVFEEVMVMGVYRALHELGLRIPEDVSVVGFDDVYTTEYMIPPLTTYDSGIGEMARLGVENLIQEIETKEPGESVKLRGDIIYRSSVARHR